MKQNYFLLFGVVATLGFILGGCDNSIQRQTTINGTFHKNLGHPFSGSAIMTQRDYYRISGEKAAEIISLPDGTKVIVTGILSDHHRSIPTAGRFEQITERVINATAFEIIG